MAEILLTINLRKFLMKQERNKRLKRAAGYVRDRIAHYTKTQPENVIISQALNNAIVKFYSKSMLPLKLSVKLEGGKATATQFKEAGAAKPENAKAKEFKKAYNKLIAARKGKGNGRNQQPPAAAAKGVEKNGNNALPHK